MAKEKDEQARPVRVELDIHALPKGTDAQALAQGAQNIARLLEDAGVFDQHGPAPAHVFRLK